MGRQPLALRGQPHAPPDPLQQLGARFPFQDRKLLGHGRRGLPKRRADRGHGAAMSQLPKQSQAGEIEHQDYLTDMIRTMKWSCEVLAATNAAKQQESTRDSDFSSRNSP